uniref:Uncharacterized protein ycf18 n=1 Tax=Polysiphonia sertularioides TaxID=945028 RepID=A0A1Z1MG31_9FLOR|nr:phycobilisome degradation protein [Polysiphonia sertularioides]
MNNIDLVQEFKITSYIIKINALNNKRVKKYLKQALRKMMIKDNMIKYIIKRSMK